MLTGEEEHPARSEETGNERTQDDYSEIDSSPDEERRQKRPNDGPEHISGSFQPVGPSEVSRLDGVCQEVVAKGRSKSPTDPGDSSQRDKSAEILDKSDGGRGEGRQKVTECCPGTLVINVMADGTAAEFLQAHEQIGDSFNNPQSGRSETDRGERQDGCRQLVADVGKECCEDDADDSPCHPGRCCGFLVLIYHHM